MIQDKIFFDEKDPTGVSYNTPFTVYGSYQGRLWSKTPTGSIKFYTQNSDLSVYATTGSNQFSGSQTVTGSLTVTGGITGSVTTASYVEYAGVANKPALVSGSSQVTYSGLTGVPAGIVSSSAQVGGYGIFATTGSNQFNGSQAVTGSLTVTGQVVAQTLNVQQVTSSIVYSSGSNIFGNSLGNTQQFTGSVSVTGSLAIAGAGTFASSVTANGDIYYYNAGNLNAIITSGAAANGRMYLYASATADIGLQAGGNSWFLNNLGIGRNDPSGPLHIYRSVTSGLGGHIILDNNGVAIGNETALLFSDGGITNTRAAISSTVEDAPYFGDIKFKTGGGTYASLTPRMIIKGGGNIGMGTVNPVDALVVSGENKTLTFEPAGDASFCGIRWSKNVAGGNVTAASILGTTEGNFGRRGIGFSTGNFADFTTNAVERMRITSVGYLQISNDGNYIASGSPYHQIKNTEATMTVYFLNHNAAGDGLLVNLNTNSTDYHYFRGYSNSAGGNRIIIYSNGNIQNVNNAYGALSDAKLKENIQDATPKLNDLMKVKIRNYNLIGEETKQIGVIAQELEEVFPSMIDESEDYGEVDVPQLDEEGNEVLNEEGEVVTIRERVNKGTKTKSVKYSVFVPMLIKAIQELKSENDTLKSILQRNNIS